MAVSPYRITLRYQTVEAAAWDVDGDGRITPDEGADLRHDLWTARLAPPAAAGMRLRVEGLDAAGVPRAWILPLSAGQTTVGVATRAYLPALDEAGLTRRAHYTATLTDASGAVLATAEGVEEDVWAGAVEPLEGQIGKVEEDVTIIRDEIGDAETPGTIKHTLSDQGTRLGDVETGLADAEADIGALFGDVADLEGDVIGLEAGLEARPIGLTYASDRRLYAIYALPGGPEEELVAAFGALAEKDTVGEEDLAEEITDVLERAVTLDAQGRAEQAVSFGGGAVTLDETGLCLTADSAQAESPAAIRWQDALGATVAYIKGYFVGATRWFLLQAHNLRIQALDTLHLTADNRINLTTNNTQGEVYVEGNRVLAENRPAPVQSLTASGTVTADGGYRTRDLVNNVRTGITGTLALEGGGTATVVNGIVVAHTPGDGKN